MSGNSVGLALYWDGKIENDSNGSKYSSPAKQLIFVDVNISYCDLLRRFYLVTQKDPSHCHLKVFCRYPMTAFQHKTIFEPIIIDGDETLKHMLTIPKRFPFVSAVQLYIEKQPVSNQSVSNVEAADESDDIHESDSVPKLRNNMTEFSLNREPHEDVQTNIASFRNIGDGDHHINEKFDDLPRPVRQNDRKSNLEVGMVFASREGLEVTVKCRSLPVHKYFTYKVEEDSGSITWFARCIYNESQKCLWSVDALKKYHGCCWEIIRIIGNHTCTRLVHKRYESNLSPKSSTLTTYVEIVDFKFQEVTRPVWRDDLMSNLEARMVFATRKKLEDAVRCWSLREHRSYVVKGSSSTTWHARCIHQNCKWDVRGSLKKDHGYWEITKKIWNHTCIPLVREDDSESRLKDVGGRPCSLKTQNEMNSTRIKKQKVCGEDDQRLSK